MKMNMVSKKIKIATFTITGFALLSLMIAFAWQKKTERPTEEMNEEKKLKVVTTIVPLYLMAKEVGGPLTEVANIIPLTVSPWEHVLTEQERAVLQDADLVIRTRTPIDRWAEGLAAANPHLRELVLGRNLQLLPTLPVAAGGEAGPEDDPYFWLDPGRMIFAVSEVRDALIDMEPGRRSQYWAQASTFTETLSSIDRDFRERFRGVMSKKIAASSSYLTYFISSFGLEWVGAGGLRTGDQPSTVQLDTLRMAIEREGAPALFAAPHDGWAQAFAVRIDVPAYTFDPLEFAESVEVNYDTVMRENMMNMSRALGYEAEME